MASLYESLTWKDLPLQGTAAAPVLPFRYGEILGEEADGPAALLIAGTHGDEGPWAALAIRSVLDLPKSALRGTLRVIFTANPLAAEANTRNAPIDSPNCIDLDGIFPGTANGSHTERLAAQITSVLTDCDVILDIHGGGSWCVNAFTKEFSGSEALTEAFAPPFYREAPFKAGGLTTFAKETGAKVINVEMGGRGYREVEWIQRISDGITRALIAEGLLDIEAPRNHAASKSTEVGATDVLRSSVAGIFVPAVGEDDVGTTVAQGTVLGKVLDLITLEEKETLRAPFGNTALMLLRPHICVVEAGALLYAVAAPL